MTLRRLFWFPLAALLAGCGVEAPTAPASIGSLLDPDGAVVSVPESPVAARASGAAHREAGGKPVVLNFSAVKHADGTVSGSYYYQSVFNHVSIHVDVTCMTVVDGNKAWVAGIISKSNIDALVGTVSYFYTFDNGEGAGTDADVVSLTAALEPEGEDIVFCTDLPTQLPEREVLHGNVNVSG